MAHLRARHLEKLLRQDLSWWRVVSVLGMRQSGKTTLLKLIARRYLTLDHPATASAFARGDWSSLDNPPGHPVAVDEAQLCPTLFPQVKLRADEMQRPGLYILTGSVRFLARKQIQESLTGRTSILELLPLTLAEAHNRPLNDLIGQALRLPPDKLLQNLKKRAWCKSEQIAHHLNCRGMPGICFKKETGTRARAWSLHLETVLSRDLQLLRKTDIGLPALRDLFPQLARHQGEALNVSALSRSIGISQPTANPLLKAYF